jgi:MoaA/NifB/PqqE/SkfB family radical SAM enzyme
MTSIREAVRRLLTPAAPLPAGLYHYQANAEQTPPYRLHLRLEPEGNGILLVNATTVLHLNQTAAEYAYHLVKQTPPELAAQKLSRRYRVSTQQAQQDFQDFSGRIQTLIDTPDLDPEIFLDFERQTPHEQKLSAPLRLDCALTYRLPEAADPQYAPTYNVERELETAEWKSILDNAWEHGIPHVVFTGGEPTLRADLPELIAHAEHNGQVSGLLSDGLRLTDCDYLETLLQTGLDYLVMNFSPENEQAWLALDNVLLADLYVAVHLTLTTSNAMETPDVLQKLAGRGVKAVSFSSSDSTLVSTLTDLRNQAAFLGLSLIWDLPVPYSSFNPVALETLEDIPPQGPGKAWLYVEPDGDVLPGQGINQVLGNFLSDAWEKVWQ